MKRYKLLKDLPTFKAGQEFFISESGNLIAGTPRSPKQITAKTIYGLPTKIDLMAYAQETLEEFPNILKDWFEEIKEPEEYFYTTVDNVVWWHTKDENKELENNRKAVGNYFETKQEAEKYLKYLKAKEVIKQDTKGFKPNWSDKNRSGYYFGTWNHYSEEPSADSYINMRISSIKFKTRKDIEESFKNHPNEWKTYLTYEQ